MIKKPPVPKVKAREIVLERRKEMHPGELKLKSKKIFDRLRNLDDFVFANKIFMTVSSKQGEVDTRRIIDFADGRRKQIFLPKYYERENTFRKLQFSNWEDLVENDEGFIEPKIGFDKDMNEIDLIIIPCVAVSLLGQRVGYGGGLFDDLMKGTVETKYVLAFEFQIFNEIETDPHDIRVDRIITERRIIDTKNR